MTSLGAGKILCMWVFWAVYVHSTVYETSYICKKQDDKSQETKVSLYSVLEDNRVLYAVTCGTYGKCMYFVYSGHSKRCRGYSDALCDDGRRQDRTTGDVMYQHTCMKRCPRKKSTYKLTFKTGRQRESDSGAGLTVGITGRCGRVGVTLENGKDVRLRKGRRSTFRFVDDSVCGLKDIGLVFTNPCHRDDWFVAYVVVEYEEMTTGNRGREKFETNRWLSANKEHKQTTGIECFNVHLSISILVDMPDFTECQPSQKCEH